MTIKCWKRTCGSMLMGSSPIITPVVCMLVAWFLCWKENSNTFWSTIVATISLPIISVLSALALGHVIMPVAILHRDSVFSNRLPFLVDHILFYCNLPPCVGHLWFMKQKLNFVSREHSGFDIIHIKHRISSIPLPHVRPPEVFRLYMSVCSMNIYNDTSAITLLDYVKATHKYII